MAFIKGGESAVVLSAVKLILEILAWRSESGATTSETRKEDLYS